MCAPATGLSGPDEPADLKGPAASVALHHPCQDLPAPTLRLGVRPEPGQSRGIDHLAAGCVEGSSSHLRPALAQGLVGWLNPLVFTPIRTDRLLIRPFRPGDAGGLAARRNDPQVARYQNWTLPYPRERAEEMVTRVVAMEGPKNEEWWMAIVCDRDTGKAFGDLALRLSWEGRTAEVGYTSGPEHWGKGYATEALQALVEHLFGELGVTRISGMLHPGNPASALVLERSGFLFEGHTRSSYWVGNECSDDWIYGMTRPDWETWRNRPRHLPHEVSLAEVSAENERATSRLLTHKTQEAFVAPMARSFTDALFPQVVDGAPVVPWMRAVKADGELVGFVMLAVRTAHHPEPCLWRLLIDRLHQRRGIGGRVLELLGEECRAMGDATLVTSWGEGKGSPRPFFSRHGFEPTGRTIDGKTEGRRHLS
jgi:RimJ/RimL family protein N-acetyltransferase